MAEARQDPPVKERSEQPEAEPQPRRISTVSPGDSYISGDGARWLGYGLHRMLKGKRDLRMRTREKPTETPQEESGDEQQVP